MLFFNDTATTEIYTLSLHDALPISGRQASLFGRTLHPLGAERRLVRVFQEDGVAGDERRDHRVYGRQIRIIPGRNDEHNSERLAADQTLKAVLGPDIEIGERLGRDLDHVPGAFLEAAHLAWREADRASHLPGQLECDLIAM